MYNPSKSLFSNFWRIGLVLDGLLIVSLVALVIGIQAPLLTLQKLYFFENQISLISAVRELYHKQEWLLFVIIGLFSLLLPFIKTIALILILHIPHNTHSVLDKTLHFIEQWGRWSMLDVYVVALLLVSVKLGALAKVTVHYGVYAFATSIFLTMIASFVITSLSHKLHHPK